MLKELTVEEIKKLAMEQELYSELNLILEDYANLINAGKKVIVKEKTTQKGKSVVFYNYDEKLYRYVKSGEFYL